MKTISSFNIDSGFVGVAEETRDGYLRCYIRMAAANRPMTYLNADGSTHTEIIKPEALFNKRSVDTFKMIPLTLNHPQGGVNSDSARSVMRGCTGHTIVRESTADAEFLGITATIHDRETAEKVKAGWQASPGYRAEKVVIGDGKLEQVFRDGNHLSVVPLARGGNDVAPKLDGIYQGDSVDAPPIWVQSEESGLWFREVPLNMDQISSILENEFQSESVATRTPVNLDQYRLTDRTMPTDLVTIQVDKIDMDLPEAQARAIQPHLDRSANFDALEVERDTLKSENAALHARIADFELMFEGSNADSSDEEEDEEVDNKKGKKGKKPPFMKDGADEINEDSSPEHQSEAEVRNLILDGLEIIDRVRSDGQMLEAMGQIKNFNSDARAIGSNLATVQRQLLKAVQPESMHARIEGWNADHLEIGYDTAMSSHRVRYQQLQQQRQQQQQRQNQDGRAVDMQGALNSDSAGKDIQFFEPVQGDAKLSTGSNISLSTLGAMSTAAVATPQGRKSLLATIRAAEKKDDEAFEAATRSANQILANGSRRGVCIS